AYPEASQATTALILGIFGLVCCGLLGIAAWVMGNNEMQAIRSGRRDPANAGTAKTARVIGIVGTVLMVVPAAVIFGGNWQTLPFFNP
ncbi:MAG TPA: DUF4190 domain-containing protein, partial [Acidimicrobiia bacterium]